MQTIRIGRDLDNDIRLVDGTVSGHHAIITFDGTNYMIQDVGSKNGTFVNGTRICGERCTGSRQLDKYDVVKIGFQPLPWLSYFESQPNAISEQPLQQPVSIEPPSGPTVTGENDDDSDDEETNGLAIAGFACSFAVPLVGLVLSIIGLKKSESRNGKGHSLAVGGIVISIIRLIVEILILIS